MGPHLCQEFGHLRNGCAAGLGPVGEAGVRKGDALQGGRARACAGTARTASGGTVRTARVGAARTARVGELVHTGSGVGLAHILVQGGSSAAAQVSCIPPSLPDGMYNFVDLPR